MDPASESPAGPAPDTQKGIDAAIARDNLDAIVAPSYSFASSPAAVAGYPDISVPVGLTPEGKPAGLWMYSGFLQEPKLLALAFDLEQAIKPRSHQPQFLGQIQTFPDAGICATLDVPQAKRRPDRSQMVGHLRKGRLIPDL